MLGAITLGKVVIATVWSGKMDSTTTSDARIVGSDLVPVQAEHPVHNPAASGPCQDGNQALKNCKSRS